jgi:tRNA (cmo5U34)-methyltransferase
METGDKIKASRGNFSFGGTTPKYFDKHVEKSVPFYNIGQDLICKISSFFLENKSIVYDLGCSTGTLINKLSNYNQKISLNIYGFDIEPGMINVAKKKIKKKKKHNIYLKSQNIIKANLKKSDIIISYYTIQFIRPKYRQFLINRIYNSLNWGGAFIFFEKVRGPDARFQDLMTQIYQEYKSDVGYNEKEIIQKSLSIRSVLEPFSSNANIQFLKRAGFKDVMTIMKYCCFEGFLAIK